MYVYDDIFVTYFPLLVTKIKLNAKWSRKTISLLHVFFETLDIIAVIVMSLGDFQDNSFEKMIP